MIRQRLLFLAFVLGLFSFRSFAEAGTILNSHKYAWSDKAGYINFENVTVSDSVLSGYAWSANSGWIKFDPAMGGVLNDGAGHLFGSAWGEKIGWIDFANVDINADGKFTGTATGSLAGTITFDCPNYCDVRTDWRRQAGAVSASPSGEGGRQIPLSPPISAESAREPSESAQAKLMDIAKDGVVDIFDFNAMMVNWGSAVCGNPADVDKDCSVGIFDFNALMVYWGVAYQL